MTTSYDTIKARLKTILQSERTIEFLNKLTDFGLSIGNSTQNTNKFIKSSIYIADSGSGFFFPFFPIFLSSDHFSKSLKNLKHRYIIQLLHMI